MKKLFSYLYKDESHFCISIIISSIILFGINYKLTLYILKKILIMSKIIYVLICKHIDYFISGTFIRFLCSMCLIFIIVLLCFASYNKFHLKNNNKKLIQYDDKINDDNNKYILIDKDVDSRFSDCLIEINELLVKYFIENGYDSLNDKRKKYSIMLSIIIEIRKYNNVSIESLIDEMQTQLKNIQDRITKYGLFITFIIGFITYLATNTVINDIKTMPSTPIMDTVVLVVSCLLVMTVLKPRAQRVYLPKLENYNNLYKILVDMKNM
ncbi:hypothetical protein DY037_07165 [Apilactobacillus micheneri]|nr:hypothetical protein DY037_07165 [Apilactobacillus micheneri]